MLRKILLVFFAVLSLYATNYEGVIFKIQDPYIYVKVSSDVSKDNINKGALVVKEVANYSSIVARAKFIDLKDNIAKLELYTFSDLKQNALPIAILLPNIGDKVIFNYLYNKSFIIAPSKEVYDFIKNKFSNYDFFNTDVLAASLYINSKILPSRNDLRNFCKTWVLGSMFVAFENEVSIYECSSLSKIGSFNLDIKQFDNINFYSNITKQLSQKSEYFSYYKDLLDRE